MRIHFLPAEQQKRNDKAVEKLRYIGYSLFVLLMATLALGAKLYLWPPRQSGTQFTSDDGRTIYSDAVVLAPDLVISPVKISGSAEFVAPGERRNARSVGTTRLPDGTEVTLMRLETPTSVVPVAVGIVEIADNLVAITSGQEWHGTVRKGVTNGYSIEPEFTLTPGTAVYREADRTTLVGFGTRTSAGSMIVPAKDVVAHFPELTGGH